MKLRCSDNCPESRKLPLFKVTAFVDEDCDLASLDMFPFDTSGARCAYCDAAAEEA